MAEAAAVRAEHWYGSLPLVGEGLPWVSADAVPELAAARALGMQAGQQILAERSELLRAGEFKQVPYAVDPLTTAVRAHEAEQLYGAKHPKTIAARASLDVDCERLYAEAKRKHDWEYYPELEQPYDAAHKSYTFHGRLLTHMVGDGLTPVAEPEEVQYRLGENVEEVTYGAVRTLGRLSIENVTILRPAHPQEQPLEVHVLTISECADWAIEAYEKGIDMPMGGYVPEDRKYMIRDIRYSTVADSRFQSQLGIPGKLIEHEDIVGAIELLQVVPEGTQLTKQQVRALQMINMNGHTALHLQALIDELASQRTGKRIYMGGEIPEDQPKDYAAVLAIAAERQADLKTAGHELGDFLMELVRKGVDHWAANGIVERVVKQRLYAMVRSDPEQAAMAFDEKTAVGIAEVMRLRSQGAELEAARRERQVFAEAPAPAYCTAGSCGLEAVDLTTDEGKAIAKELGLTNGETLTHDTERVCINCKKKGSIYYAHDSKKVKKYCSNCEAKVQENTK